MHVYSLTLLKRVWKATLTVGAFYLTIISQAVAQDWAQPMVDISNNFSAGLSLVLKILVLVVAVGYGGYCAVRGQLDFMRIAVILVGASMVFYGSDMLSELMTNS